MPPLHNEYAIMNETVNHVDEAEFEVRQIISAEYQSFIDETSNNYATTFSTFKSSLHSLDRLIRTVFNSELAANIAGELQTIPDELSRIRREFDFMEQPSDIRRIVAFIPFLTSAISRIEEIADQLEEEGRTKKRALSEASALERQREQLRSEIETTAQDTLGIQAEIDAITTEIAELEVLLAQDTPKMNGRRVRKGALKKTLDQLKKRIPDIMKRLGEKQKRLKSKKEELEQASAYSSECSCTEISAESLTEMLDQLAMELLSNIEIIMNANYGTEEEVFDHITNEIAAKALVAARDLLHSRVLQHDNKVEQQRILRILNGELRLFAIDIIARAKETTKLKFSDLLRITKAILKDETMKSPSENKIKNEFYEHMYSLSPSFIGRFSEMMSGTQFESDLEKIDFFSSNGKALANKFYSLADTGNLFSIRLKRQQKQTSCAIAIMLKASAEYAKQVIESSS